jgi:hypothetical protein
MEDMLSRDAWSWRELLHPHARVTEQQSLPLAVAELESMWRDHVERAEGRGGLHAFLCAAAPRYMTMVSHLRKTERRILADLGRLRRTLERRSAEAGWLIAEYGRIARAVAAHDQLETEILCDAIERG